MAFISEWFWFFLFLPLAALSGWVVGRRGGQRHGDQHFYQSKALGGVAKLV